MLSYTLSRWTNVHRCQDNKKIDVEHLTHAKENLHNFLSVAFIYIVAYIRFLTCRVRQHTPMTFIITSNYVIRCEENAESCMLFAEVGETRVGCKCRRWKSLYLIRSATRASKVSC